MNETDGTLANIAPSYSQYKRHEEEADVNRADALDLSLKRPVFVNRNFVYRSTCYLEGSGLISNNSKALLTVHGRRQASGNQACRISRVFSRDLQTHGI